MKKTLSSFLLTLFPFYGFSTTLSVEQTLANSLEQFVANNEPGCSLAYGNPSNEIFYSKGILKTGSSDLINSRTSFITASTSKHFTAYLALLLVKQHELSLDGLAKDYYPQLATDENITVNDLMNHTSGIPDHWSIFELQGRSLTEDYRQTDALALLEENLSLQFKPGQDYKYSNGGYAALAKVIENVSKQNLNTLLDQYVNKPLSISAQFLEKPNSLPKPYAKGHIKTASGFKPFMGNSTIYGGGNLVINAQDFSRWARYLNQQLSTMPFYLYARHSSARFNHYFAGLYIENDETGRQFLQHGGYYENYTQSIVLIPDSQEYAVALCNRADFRPSNVLYEFLSAIGSLTFTSVQLPQDINEAKGLIPGLFINSEKNDIAMIIQEEGSFYYYGQLVSSPKLLKPVADNTWVAKLSTSEITLKLTGDNGLSITNRQNHYNYSPIAMKDTLLPIKATEVQKYTNPVIGEILFRFAHDGQINFVSSVGEIPVTCIDEGICWSEEGYIVVNVVSPNKIVVSTNDIKHLVFLKSAE